MNNKEWLELIKKHEESILDAGEKAYRSAMENRHLQYHVELHKDCGLNTWYQQAGGNSQTASTFEGEAITVGKFCFQYYEVEVTIEALENKALEKEIDIEELKEEMDWCDSLYDMLSENHLDIIQECEQEALEFDISECAREYAQGQLDVRVRSLESI